MGQAQLSEHEINFLLRLSIFLLIASSEVLQ